MTRNEAQTNWIPYFNRIVVQCNGCHYINELSGRVTIRIKEDNKKHHERLNTTLTRVAMVAENLMSVEQFYDEKILICHKCDDERCVNIDDLYLGDNTSNALDTVIYGRDPHSNKTHCPQGHEYNRKNTYLYGSKRQCLICKSNNNRRYYNIKKQG